MTNEKLDPTKLYSWFVVDTRFVTTNGKTFLKMVTSCVEENARVFERFYLKDGRTCKSLEHRIALIGGGRVDGTPPEKFFHRSKGFYANVQPTMDAEGDVIWVFNPFSFKATPVEQPAQEPDVKQKVRDIVKKKLPPKSL